MTPSSPGTAQHPLLVISGIPFTPVSRAEQAGLLFFFLFFFYKFIYLFIFIFGCVGSSFLCEGFL